MLDMGSEMNVEMWWRRVGQSRSGFDATALHERQQLLRDLGQYVLGQTSHAQHLISRAVDVVPERHKLTDTYTFSSCSHGGLVDLFHFILQHILILSFDWFILNGHRKILMRLF